MAITLAKIRLAFATFGALLVCIVLLLATPYFQRHAIYLNKIKLPPFADFDAPERYGLAPNKTYNLHIRTNDNETIGAWFILSDQFYHSKPFPPLASTAFISEALKKYPTVLFLHGNAATRALRKRVQQYQPLSSRLSCNVMAVDYRGFADSTGTPSEEGLITDARAAWDWLITHGAKSQDVLILGHSLGTGVGSGFAATLSKNKIKYRGLVLMSPFASIQELLQNYQFLKLVPLFKPFSYFPFMMDLINKAIIHRFDTLKAVPHINGDVLILHAENDWDIPYTHSKVLFETFLDPLLPPVDLPPYATILSKEEWEKLNAQTAARKKAREPLVKTTDIKNFGTIEAFNDGSREVTFVKTLRGEHNSIGLHEGVHDIIGHKFGLFR